MDTTTITQETLSNAISTHVEPLSATHRVLTFKQIQNAIDRLAKRQSDTNDVIQELLVQCTFHALYTGNGNVTPFAYLVEHVVGVDRKAIMTWATNHAPVRFSVDPGTKKLAVKLNQGKFKEMRNAMMTMAELDAMVHWTKYTPDPSEHAQTFDIEARALSLIKQYDEKKDNAKITLKNVGFVQYLKDAIAKYDAQVAKVAA